VQKKTSNLIIAYQNVRNLSIQFSLDGFSFCISNQQGKIGNLTAYIFDKKVSTPEELLTQIEQIFKTDAQLQQDFNTILAIHQNDLATLVPNAYFDKKNLKNYLNFNIKTLSTDYISYDDLKNIEAKNIYIPYVNINNYLFQHFGEFEYKHHTTILIDKLLAIAKNKTATSFYVYVAKNNFTIIVIKNNELIFNNTFSFTTKEDFIYYLLFTAEQLQLNPETFLLTFLGAIEKDSEIFNITYQYIRNIEFYESKNPVLTETFSKHSHFILAN